MTDRLSPEREAEIRAAVAELDADRALSFGTWTAGPVSGESMFPPEMAFVVEDVARVGGAAIRGSVGVFGSEPHARFTALARTAISELLAELTALRDAQAGCVLVPADEYEQFEDDSAKLAALEAAGVDSWEGYDNALQAVAP